MKGFGIYIQNDLLEPKHIEAMGISVWLYMWLLDKMTSINEEQVGAVLGGKPIKFEEIGDELGISADTYTRWMQTLEEGGYIKAIRTPAGISFRIYKAKKRFRKSAESDSAQMRSRIRTNAESNIRQYKDNTVDNTVAVAGAPAEADSSKKKKKPDDSNEPMTIQQFLDWCRVSPHRHIKLIAEYADERKIKHSTKGQWRQFITRNLRAAKSLSPYTDKQISDAMKKLLKDTKEQGGFMTKWTLETVVKYID